MKTALPLILSIGLLSPFSHAIELTPGKWAITVEMNAPGMPENMRTQVQQDCVTAEEAANPEDAMRESWKEDNCDTGDIRSTDNGLEWEAECTMPGSNAKTRITGKMVMHNSKHYSTDITVKGNHHSMKTHSEAKWVGACNE